MSTPTISFIAGDDYAIKLTANSAGNPFPLDGFVFNLSAKDTYDASKPLISLDVQVLTEGSNECFFLLTGEETAKLSPGKYLFGILMKTPTGSLRTVLTGHMKVMPRINHLGA